MYLMILVAVGTVLQGFEGLSWYQKKLESTMYQMLGHVIATPDLDAVIQRLDEIDAKYARVDALLTGFEQLCQSINHLKATNVDKNSESLEQCGHGGKHSDSCILDAETVANGNEMENVDNEGDVVNGNEVNAPKVDDRHTGDSDKLEIVSVHSDGNIGGKVRVSVVYIADETYVSEWFFSGKNVPETRSSGEVDIQTRNGGRIEFVSKLELPESTGLDYVLFMINSQFYSASIDFNISKLDTQGSDIILPLQYDILDFQPYLEIPDNKLKAERLHTSITVTEDVVEHLSRDDYLFDVSLDMFNSTSSPPVLTNVWYHSSQDNISITANGDDQVDIVVASQLARFGGILTVRINQNTDNYKLVRGLTCGVKIKFINEAIGGLMSYGTFGLYKHETIVLVRGQSFNALCMAFGVPIPQVTMLKEEGNGQMVEIEPDYEVVLEPFTYKVVNVHVQSQNTVGIITCTASDGNVTQTHNTTFKTVTWARFDEKKTRIVKNTTGMVVIACKATGDPVPDIRLRTNDAKMRNLLDDVRFEHKFTKKKFANKVTLTMLPPDKSIRSVLCVAEQSIEGHFDMVTKEIEIFPPKF